MNLIHKFIIIMLCFLPLAMQAMMPSEQPLMPVGRTELAVGVAAGAAGIFFLTISYKLFKNLVQNKYSSNTVSYRDGSGRIMTTTNMPEDRLRGFMPNDANSVRRATICEIYSGPGWKTHGAILGTGLCFAIGLSAVAYSLSPLLRWRVAGLSS